MLLREPIKIPMIFFKRAVLFRIILLRRDLLPYEAPVDVYILVRNVFNFKLKLLTKLASQEST